MSFYVADGYVSSGYFQTGISIDWGARIIHVPKTFLQTVQLVPTEIYNLDIDLFRRALRELESGDEGMSFLSTHNHNTTVTLSGITYARIIEIINGYTVTFEDGAYAVNFIGANSNIGDVTNVNNVSIRPNNSAGLVQIATGSGLSLQQATQLLKIYQSLMLDPTAPVTTRPDVIEFDDVIIDLTGDPEAEIIGTRRP